jgi:asparagine synthase (glutamine-hydrolysing)
VDSSIIAYLIKKASNKTNKTFTVSFDLSGEKEEAHLTSSALKTDHFDILVSKNEYFKEIPKVMWHFDEPVADPSAVGLYFLAKGAREQVKVVLSGEGADEFFGGYNIYRSPFVYRFFSWIPKFILRFFVSLPFDYFGKNFLKRALYKLSDWYFGQKYFNKSVLNEEDIDLLWKGQKDYLRLDYLYQSISDKNYSDSEIMQVVDINTWLVGDILAKADKMTMAHSLELRVPFLDVAVSKVAQIIKPEFKWKNGQTKFILREAFKNVIPEATRTRRKLGFPVPLREWILSDSKDIYLTIIKNNYIKKNFNLEYIKDLFDSHMSKKEDNTRKIYILYILSVWYNVFIEEKI